MRIHQDMLTIAEDIQGKQIIIILPLPLFH